MLQTTHSELVHALTRPECYPHPVSRVETIDTGRSWLFLTGQYAYKIKKPVSTGCPDCSTLAARGFACEEELRLNRRFAPSLYVEVVEIRGSQETPRIGGDGPTIDYALKMRQFPRDALASRMLARGTLTAELMAKLARHIARFHRSIRPSKRSRFGTPGCAYRSARHDMQQLERMSRRAAERECLNALDAWTEREFMLRSHDLQFRWESHMVREGHGDLRLGKVVLLDGELVPFDCLDDRPELRWNDVMGDIAMLIMDLLDLGAPRFAQPFLNAYLEESGDYAGLSVLRFYLVKHALNRAKTRLVRARRAEPGSAKETRLLRSYKQCLTLASRETQPQRPALILMHGVSDILRSAIAATLAQELGAIAVRHAIELGRTRDVPPLDSSAVSGSGFCGQRAAPGIYETLAQTARQVVGAGYTAIVDAPCLRRSERAALADVARPAGVPLAVLSVHVSEALLRAGWMAEFAPVASQALDERLGVLEHELLTMEPIAPAEGLTVVELHRERGLTSRALEQIRAALDAQRIEASAQNSAPASYVSLRESDTLSGGAFPQSRADQCGNVQRHGPVERLRQLAGGHQQGR